MACPYFFPTEALDQRNAGPRPPLGQLYRGQCHVTGAPAEPEPGELTEGCNWGYAHGRCRRLHAAEQAADAVRFAAEPESGGQIAIRWVVLEGHLPAGHGTARFQPAEGKWDALPSSAVRSRQIEAYLKSCLAAQSSR